MKTVVLLSGGMNSTALLYERRELGDLCFCLSFDYGQWHARELDCARHHADRLGLRHKIVKLEAIVDLVGNDPELPLADLLTLSIAASYAQAEGCEAIAWGFSAANCPNHGARESAASRFVEEFRGLLGCTPARRINLLAPYVGQSKRFILEAGIANDLDFRSTYSCDEGEPKHCGQCSGCLSRRAAFVAAERIDPTEYEKGE